MPIVFIGVGSNLGDRESHLLSAKTAFLTCPAVHDLCCSPVYESNPVDAEGGNYLNAVWSFETDSSPREILDMLHGIEEKAGRVRGSKNAPRTLDLDLLFYDAEVINKPDFQVPHPRLEDRAFVLMPLCDLAPEWEHPALKKTAKELLQRDNVKQQVIRRFSAAG